MIILNEKEYAENCIKNGLGDNNIFTTLSILAKYYYHAMGYRKKKITQELQHFLELYYPQHLNNRLYWDSHIEKLATRAGKSELFVCEGVWITESELNKIDTLENKKQKMLAFTLLCLAKYRNIRNEKNNSWVTNERKEIFELACVDTNVIYQDFYIGDLKDFGLLELAKKNDNLSVRVTFIDEDSGRKLFISDFRKLGYEYLLYCGEKYIRCKKCGILTKSSQSRVYCNDCSGYQKNTIKIVTCIDCGKTFIVSSLNTKTTRCEDCYIRYRKEYQSQKNAENYAKMKAKNSDRAF